MDSSGRRNDGTFAKGNKFGQGRPPRQTERQYLSTLSEQCDPEAWREIVATAVEDARNGDHKARSWLGSYLIGPANPNGEALHLLAVEEAAGVDKLEVEARKLAHDHILDDVLFPSLPAAK